MLYSHASDYDAQTHAENLAGVAQFWRSVAVLASSPAGHTLSLGKPVGLCEHSYISEGSVMQVYLEGF